MKTAKMMAMVVTLLVCVAVPASAAVGPLLNGSFEEYVPTPSWDIWEGTGHVFSPATSWIEVPPGAYVGSMRTGTESIFATDLDRFLRLPTDLHHLYGYPVFGRAAQLLGTMVTGETYTFEADVIASTQYGPYAATAAFVNEAAEVPGTVYASQTKGGTDTFNLVYTATAADNGNALYIWLQAEWQAQNYSRGGIDRARLTIMGAELTANPPGGSTLNFGDVPVGGTSTLYSAVQLSSTGDPGTTVDLQGAFFGPGSDPFELVGGDPDRDLLQGESEAFDLQFDATGLLPGLYETEITFQNDSPEGPVTYYLSANVVGGAVPEPAGLGLIGAALLVLKRRRS